MSELTNMATRLIALSALAAATECFRGGGAMRLICALAVAKTLGETLSGLLGRFS